MKISTFIANRNHGKYLRRSINSILNQLMPCDFELILIDDASFDNSVSIMREFEKHPNVKILPRANHLGHIHAYRRGIMSASGDWVHLMAADDEILDKTFYEKAVKKFQECPELSMVFGGLRTISEEGDKTLGEVLPPLEGIHEAKEWLVEMAKYGNYICGGAVLVRLDVQMEVGMYDIRLPFSADWMNWINILSTQRPACAIREPVYGYRKHHGQMTYKHKAPERERLLCYEALSEALRAAK